MTDLDQLLRNLAVRPRHEEYVYILVPTLAAALTFEPAALIQEAEGVTAIVPRRVADANSLDYEYIATWLTLEIHSALDAVGLTASFSAALADAGISCNVIAGYHHDHILVPSNQAETATRTLHDLADSRSMPKP